MLEMTSAYGLNFLVPAGDTGVGRCLREFGEFARVEVEAIRQLVGRGAYVDVGANIGAIALPVATIGTRVITAEANRGFANVLAANALNNRLLNVEPHHAAVGQTLQIAKFPMLPLSAHGNIGVSGFELTGRFPDEVVQMTTVDRLAPAETSVVKIDVEGYELQVMRGATKTLHVTRPAWIVEASSDTPQNRDVIQLFVDAGYRLFWLYTPFVTLIAERRGDPTLIKRGDINFLALPEGKDFAWDILPVDPAGPWPMTRQEFPYLRDFGFKLEQATLMGDVSTRVPQPVHHTDDPVMSSSVDIAIVFEPEGYVLEGARLMGRQSAGNGFLRAAVAGLKDGTLFAYTPRKESAELFTRMVSAIDPTARTDWIPANDLDQLTKVGTLYVPDPSLAERARLRLRVGPAAYSLVGVTHTTGSQRAMDGIADLLFGPVMPWDALICTSSAVATTVRTLLAAEANYLRWRLGVQRFTLPQLPVIPLGVHCDDWATNAQERSSARQELGIAPDQLVALFVGRLSSDAKAHPYPLYAGLEATAQRTRKAIALVQCGWFSSAAVEHAFKEGARQFCPSCTVIWANGKSAEERRRAWASADIFISLSDNIQETFGLTPIEAMAAGLPVVVTDWDGYKDTVRDGQDGFRIPTWLAPAGLGESLGQAYEAGTHSYDQHCGAASQLTSIDMRALVDRLSDLAEQPQLRRQLGEAGRQRARGVYDWSVIFRQYKALWRELAERRAKSDPRLTAGGPKVAPGRMNPLRAFGHYATRHLSSETRIELSGSPDAWPDLIRHPLFSSMGVNLQRGELIEAVLETLGSGNPVSLVELNRKLSASPAAVATAVCLLAKMNLVRLIA